MATEVNFSIESKYGGSVLKKFRLFVQTIPQKDSYVTIEDVLYKVTKITHDYKIGERSKVIEEEKITIILRSES